MNMGHINVQRSNPADEGPIILEEGEESLFGTVMFQLSLKEGLKKCGKRGKAGAMKEMTQLHNMQAFFLIPKGCGLAHEGGKIESLIIAHLP